MVLLVQVLGVATLLLLLLHLHPAGRHCGREARRQCFEARQLHQRRQALHSQHLVHQEVNSLQGEEVGRVKNTIQIAGCKELDCD